MSRPDGLLLDCDGTLVDTEPLSRTALERALASFGATLSEADVEEIVGQSWEVTSARLLPRTGVTEPELRAEVAAHFDREMDERLAPFDDTVRTLRAAVAAGVPVAVCSASRRDHVLRCVRAAGVAGDVTAVVGADDVDASKPDPAPYLLAAARLGVDARRCVAVEDSAPGIASARGAGARVVAVDRIGRPDRLADADVVVAVVTPASVGLAPADRATARLLGSAGSDGE